MDRYIYIAMTGAKHALKAQQVISNNLANANTPGFRADLHALLSRPVTGPGYPSRVYSVETSLGSSLAQGHLMSTGRELDVAINGEGWLAVQARDGTEAYTRRGDLRITDGGLLQTGSGQLVLGNAGPVAIPPAKKVTIGQDGTITVIPLGQSANAPVVVDRLRLVNPPPEALHKGEDGLFRLEGGAVATADAGVSVVSGALEASNVNTVEALVNMIDNARHFETYVKLIEIAKGTDKAGQRLLRTS
ncbi:MAG: flagellar basal-body rod protein FlgF [Nitrococcus sp.]|nr:flagellar basal-body rod protein FlgF [Nitrococcus sp.]